MCQSGVHTRACAPPSASHGPCTGRSHIAPQSRFDPLAFIGDTRPLHRTFFAVLNGASITDPEPVHVASDPQKWAYGQSTSVRTTKHVISACISFLARAACVPLLDRLPERVAHDLCRDTNTVACLCAKGVALQTGLVPLTLLDPKPLHGHSQCRKTRLLTDLLETGAQ